MSNRSFLNRVVYQLQLTVINVIVVLNERLQQHVYCVKYKKQWYIYTSQWILLNSIAKDIRVTQYQRDLLKGFKPATVAEPNNQDDRTITGLHPYTSSQFAWQAQKVGLGWGWGQNPQVRCLLRHVQPSHPPQSSSVDVSKHGW